MRSGYESHYGACFLCWWFGLGWGFGVGPLIGNGYCSYLQMLVLSVFLFVFSVSFMFLLFYRLVLSEYRGVSFVLFKLLFAFPIPFPMHPGALERKQKGTLARF